MGSPICLLSNRASIKAAFLPRQERPSHVWPAFANKGSKASSSHARILASIAMRLHDCRRHSPAHPRPRRDRYRLELQALAKKMEWNAGPVRESVCRSRRDGCAGRLGDIYITALCHEAQAVSELWHMPWALGRAIISTPTGTPRSAGP